MTSVPLQFAFGNLTSTEWWVVESCFACTQEGGKLGFPQWKHGGNKAVGGWKAHHGPPGHAGAAALLGGVGGTVTFRGPL